MTVTVRLRNSKSRECSRSGRIGMRGLPDGTEVAILYAVNMALASAMGDRRTGRSPLFGLAIFGAIAAQALVAAKYMKSMITVQSKACIYCITGALVNFTLIFLSAPEALGGVRLINS